MINSLIVNKYEKDVIALGVTEQDIENADEIGYVGRYYGIDVYVARSVPVNS